MSKFIKIAIWFILFMVGLSISLSMISAANTIENILGCIVLIFIGVISIKTKCLTLIKLERKHEK